MVWEEGVEAWVLIALGPGSCETRSAFGLIFGVRALLCVHMEYKRMVGVVVYGNGSKVRASCLCFWKDLLVATS
jgi:hypothetical protein